jgi:hypothetical protein
MVDPAEAEALEKSMASASTNIRKSVGGKPGESNEKLYGQAYRALVRAGLRTALKKRYR